jgi:hypothetical protein
MADLSVVLILVVVVSVLAFILSTVVKGVVRVVGLAVLAMLAVLAVGQPAAEQFPELAELIQNWTSQLENQVEEWFGEDGGGGSERPEEPFTDAETDTPISEPSPSPSPVPRPRDDAPPAEEEQRPVTAWW